MPAVKILLSAALNMDKLTLYLGLLIFVFLSILSWRVQRRRLCLPPGPCPLPLVGNLLQGITMLYKSYHKFRQEHGPVFTIWMGLSPVVILCGYKVVKDALVNNSHIFGTRGPMPTAQSITKGYGILLSNGERWQKMRRFIVTTLRIFGKKSLQQTIQEEVHYLAQTIVDTEGKEFDPQKLLGFSAMNVINVIIFGRRWDYEDENFQNINHLTFDVFHFLRCPFGLIYSAFHRVMKYLPGPQTKFFQDSEKLKSFIHDEILSHRETLDPNLPRDCIDHFLIRINKEEDFSQENLMYLVLDLLVAGSEPVSNVLQFTLLVMIRNQHIQDRVQQEIDTVIGSHRIPEMEDQANLPYTNAVIHEILRFLDLAPNSLPLKVKEDTIFQGFRIPKGTTVFPLLCSVLTDPEYWETPDEFTPEHFLDQDGKFVNKEAFLPFSTGKRVCPGEGLARMILFLFVTILLQKFTFRMPSEEDPKPLSILRRKFHNDGLSFCLRAIPRY